MLILQDYKCWACFVSFRIRKFSSQRKISKLSNKAAVWTYPIRSTLWVYILSLRQIMVLLSFGIRRKHLWSNSAPHSRWVDKQVHFNKPFYNFNHILLYPREKSAVCVGIMMGISRMISPPETKKLWLKPSSLETAGKWHLLALMQKHWTILVVCTHTGRRGH